MAAQRQSVVSVPPIAIRKARPEDAEVLRSVVCARGRVYIHPERSLS
jgi:hypothetical protein